jgi:sulfatase maturation enzyme AslB (radical SAM superfamily)
MNKKTFCTYPFFQITMKTLDDQGYPSSYAPCCNSMRPENGHHLFDTPAETINPQEFFNSEGMTQLRSDLLNGIKSPICNACWETEDAGLNSHRQIDWLPGDVELDTVNPTLQVIDTMASRKCNLRCIMCNPGSSDSLDKDLAYFMANSIKKKEWSDHLLNMENGITDVVHKELPIIEWCTKHYDQIKGFKISGGEPFMDPSFKKMIIELTDKYDHIPMTLDITTNGTKITKDMLSRLSKFKKILLTLSIDGTGGSYEYIRFPYKYTQIQKRIHEYMTYPDLDIEGSINLVVNSLNVLCATDLVRWLGRYPNITSINAADMHPEDNPLNLKHLSVDVLQEAANRLIPIGESHSAFKENYLERILYAIDENDENKERLLNELKMFDGSRGVSHKDYLDPILLEWLHE